MTPQTTNPAGGQAIPGSGNTPHPNRSKPPKKWQRVLLAFVEGRSLNRFECTRDLRDWCLHSTVSTLQAKGVIIHRCDETVLGYQDIPTHVTRYWLAPESMEHALFLLGKKIASDAKQANA